MPQDESIKGVTDVPVRYFRHRVTPDYFSALGIPLLRGRLFTAADRDSAAVVVVISEATARRFWPGADAVGRRIKLGDATGEAATVIGVVGTARFRDLTTNLASPRSEPDVFFAFDQRTEVDLSLIVRAREGTTALLPALQRELSAVDPGIPLFAATPMRDLIDQQTARSRFGSTLLGTFSVVALALAAIGIYGVLAFVIGLSRREIWRYEVTNASIIPRQYWMLDHQKLGAVVRALKGGASIPGVRVWSEATVAARTAP